MSKSEVLFSRLNDSDFCCFCRRAGSESVSNPLLKAPRFRAHRLCLAFNSRLSEHFESGIEDDKLIESYDYDKVYGAFCRDRAMRCSGCKKNNPLYKTMFGASAGCAIGKCRKSYHYPCAPIKKHFKRDIGYMLDFYRVYCSREHVEMGKKSLDRELEKETEYSGHALDSEDLNGNEEVAEGGGEIREPTSTSGAMTAKKKRRKKIFTAKQKRLQLDRKLFVKEDSSVDLKPLVKRGRKVALGVGKIKKERAASSEDSKDDLTDTSGSTLTEDHLQFNESADSTVAGRASPDVEKKPFACSIQRKWEFGNVDLISNCIRVSVSLELCERVDIDSSRTDDNDRSILSWPHCLPLRLQKSINRHHWKYLILDLVEALANRDLKTVLRCFFLHPTKQQLEEYEAVHRAENIVQSPAMDINAVYSEAILSRLKDVTATGTMIERLDNTFVIDIDDKLDPLMEIRRRLPLSPFIWTFDQNESDVCADSAPHSSPSTDSFAAAETTAADSVWSDLSQDPSAIQSCPSVHPVPPCLDLSAHSTLAKPSTLHSELDYLLNYLYLSTKGFRIHTEIIDPGSAILCGIGSHPALEAMIQVLSRERTGRDSSENKFTVTILKSLNLKLINSTELVKTIFEDISAKMEMDAFLIVPVDYLHENLKTCVPWDLLSQNEAELEIMTAFPKDFTVCIYHLVKCLQSKIKEQ